MNIHKNLKYETQFDLNEIEVARDIEYLKELNATEEEIEITKQVLKNNYSDSSNLLRTIL